MKYFMKKKVLNSRIKAKENIKKWELYKIFNHIHKIEE